MDERGKRLPRTKSQKKEKCVIRTDGGNGQKEKPRKDKDLMKEFNKELQRAVGRDEKQHYKDICKTSKMERGTEK